MLFRNIGATVYYIAGHRELFHTWREAHDCALDLGLPASAIREY